MEMSHSDAGRRGGEASRQRGIERRVAYSKNPKKCLFCNDEIPYEKRRSKFCNNSCAASFNNVGVRRHGSPPRNCAFCKAELKGSQKKYCSRDCQRDDKYNEWLCRWLEGKCSGNYDGRGVKPRKWVYRWVKDTFGEKCAICETDEWMGKPVPLVLDHIDGDATNTTPDNVRLVCRNCDGQLPTFCGRNMGNGKRGIVISYK